MVPISLHVRGDITGAGGGLVTANSPKNSPFRQFLVNPDAACDFLQSHLRSELSAPCDRSTLKQESGSFVEEDLR
ncbi:Rpn family recombination-promoting nuclease/putative transposase [Salmonella enterica subsp. enterica serovar Kinondoni]|nr:Rpn family recombination-promoting nuclease/putative transposase [Salmonella enterica subsp. enterica serovar Kinondoni]